MPGRRRQAEPKQHETRQAARRQRMAARMACADSPEGRVGVAADHLRAALRYVPPAVAERLARDAVTALNQLVEHAYREEAQRR